MFEKFKLKKQIEECKKNIAVLEQKRTRSQAALLEAILKNATPNDQDVDFFNQFTEKIENERNRMHQFMSELDKLTKK